MDMDKNVSFSPERLSVVFRKGPLGFLLQEPSDEARRIKNNPTLQDKSAPMSEDLVQQNALALVRQRGGATSEITEVLGDYVLQFGEYKGRSFRWLLMNDIGYTLYLIKKIQEEEATGISTTEGHSNDSLRSFVHYALGFYEVQYLLANEDKELSVEDDQLGLGTLADSTGDNRAEGYAPGRRVAELPGVPSGAQTVPSAALSTPPPDATAELQASPAHAPASLGTKTKTPVPLPPQLAFLLKETAGPIKEERIESAAVSPVQPPIPVSQLEPEHDTVTQDCSPHQEQQDHQQQEQKKRQIKTCLTCRQPKSRFAGDGSSVHFFYQRGPARYFYCSKRVHQIYSADGLSDPKMSFEEFQGTEFFKRELEGVRKQAEERAEKKRKRLEPEKKGLLCRFCRLALKQGPNSPHIHTCFPGVAGKYIYCPSKVFSVYREKGMAKEMTWEEFQASPFYEAEKQRWVEGKKK